MSEQPLISVGIPTFNRPDGLRRALTRVVNQTYRNLEIVISDNHSDDAAAVKAVVDSFANVDPRIRFFRQKENLGSTGNFHFLARAAQGEYFLWAADDDEIESEYVATLFNALRANPRASVAMTGYDVTDTMAEPHIFLNLTEHLHGLKGASAFERLRNYILQPDHLGKSRIVWGMFSRALLVRAFEECLTAYQGGPPILWADLPIEVRILAQGDLVVESKNLFHVYLLASSDGRQGLSHKMGKLMKVAARSYHAYRAVIRDAPVSESERRALLGILARKYRKDRVQLLGYYGVIGRVPVVARYVKKLWYYFS